MARYATPDVCRRRPEPPDATAPTNPASIRKLTKREQRAIERRRCEAMRTPAGRAGIAAAQACAAILDAIPKENDDALQSFSEAFRVGLEGAVLAKQDQRARTKRREE